MSLRGKFHIAFGIIASLATGLVIYGLLALGETRNLVFRLYDEPLVGVSYARAASATLNAARGVMERGLLLGPAGTVGVTASLQRMQADIIDDLRIVRERMHAPDVIRALNDADGAIKSWFDAGEAILAPPAAGVTQLPMPQTVERRSAVAVARLDDLVEIATANGFAFRAQAEAEMRTSALTLAGLAGGIITLSALFALLFVQLLIGPIRAATQIAEDVAAGKVSPVGPSKRRDEIGRLLTSLASMQASLRGRATQALALLHDKEQNADRLRLINSRFDAALNNMTHGLLMTDGDRRVVVINRRFCEIYRLDPQCVWPGCSLDDVMDLSIAAGNHGGQSVHDLYIDLRSILQTRQRYSTIQTIADDRVVAVSYEPMSDGGWTATHEDITERRRSEDQIVFLARHDALTQLPNRTVFQERLAQAVAQCGRGKGFALLYLDLDQFKEVNDSLGHPVGDDLLCQVAERLQDLVRDVDTVARLGGDEFAILQFQASMPSDAEALARRAVEIVSMPYEVDGNRIVIGVSIGIALAPADGTHGATLLKNADLALYSAKRGGRGRWHFFEPCMDATASARRVLETELRDPGLLDQLELHYQPVVSSATREVTGFEALVRWRHPTMGLVPPIKFITVAEEIGTITAMGTWVLQQACAQAAQWPEHLTVAVNLSPLQFRGATLVDVVADALRHAAIAPRRLILEITESALLNDNATTLAMLHTLRESGVRIAMDDFGTGYSSLSYLRCFPFDTIKIDRSFVTDLQAGGECMAIIHAVVGLAGSLRMNTIAEGVETEEQFRVLAEAGCTEIQGYLFSKPVEAVQLPGLIARLSGLRRLALVAASGA